MATASDNDTYCSSPDSWWQALEIDSGSLQKRCLSEDYPGPRIHEKLEPTEKAVDLPWRPTFVPKTYALTSLLIQSTNAC